MLQTQHLLIYLSKEYQYDKKVFYRIRNYNNSNNCWILFLIKIVEKAPAVKDKYYEENISQKDLEKKYTNKGEYKVKYIEYSSKEETIKKYEIWYPEELENSNNKYPVVIMANGTGVPASKYKPIFEHLASWGFIVVGNEDKESWNGKSSSLTLDYILSLNGNSKNILYNKIDTEKIGIGGHSQGGVGAINAVTNYDNSYIFKSFYTASCAWIDLAIALKWNYDINKINIPYFMVAGTGRFDSETITPLSSLENAFNNINNNKLTIMARRKNADHGEMLSKADGYMTAWFLYTLMNDKETKNIFIGENAEILQNNNWQDIKIKNS